MPDPDSPAFDWRQLLLQEYERLQNMIDKYDGQRVTIRGWSITATAAIFAASLSTNHPSIAAGGVVIAVLFWVFEAVIMNTQSNVIARSNELEAIVANDRLNADGAAHYVFGVGQAYGPAQFLPRRIPHMMFVRSRYNMVVFYVGLLIVTAAGALIAGR